MELNLFKTRNDFEDMVRDVKEVFDSVPRLVNGYLGCVEFIEELRPKWKRLVETNDNLYDQLDQSQKKIEELESVLSKARKKVEDEMVKSKRATEELKQHKNQLKRAQKILNDESAGLDETAWERLSFLKSCGDYDRNRLGTIEEAETTGSVMTDLSYTRDEAGLLLDGTIPETGRKKRRLAEKENNDSIKRRKSTTYKSLEVKTGESVVATTTVTLDPHSCTATSVIENISTPLGVKTPHPRTKLGLFDNNYNAGDSENECALKNPSSSSSLHSQISPFSVNSINTRPHNFVQKSVFKGDTCNACQKKIRFSTLVYKCRDCKALFHIPCKDNAPLPCVPHGTTPNKHNKDGGVIADFTPLTCPMVPALVIHCIKEIEARGMNEIGLYRIPGSDKEVKSLKERFLKNRGVPNLSELRDIHTVSGTLKEFLRSLKEPIVTAVRWADFVRALDIPDFDERRARFTDIIGELPRPNRDTLSYIVLHLQRVAESEDCKMGPDNLSVVFGQTIVGLSRRDPDEPYAEAKMANRVMLELIKLPGENYEAFLKEFHMAEPTLTKTPSANSLKYFVNSPHTVKPLKKIKYFETP